MLVFFNDTATTEIYTLSLHDALPISHLRGARRARDVPRAPAAGARRRARHDGRRRARALRRSARGAARGAPLGRRSEEHTSELQSRQYLVCRLLLEKKKQISQVLCSV